MRVTGTRRRLIALAGLAVLAALAWFTMDAGRIRLLVVVVLGGFAARIALTPDLNRGQAEGEEDGQRLR